MKELFLKRFLFYKDLGDKTFEHLSDDEVLWQYNTESNSIATIVKHIAGNMFSRWTNFLTEDGEKEYRNRDADFLNDIQSKAEMIAVWENGWKVLLEAINLITDENINTPIFIRGEKHSLLDAVLRQLAHYSYHVGQIVYAAKILKNDAWKTLSIARNKSAEYNWELLTKLNATEIPQNFSPVCYAKSDDVRDDYKLE